MIEQSRWRVPNIVHSQVEYLGDGGGKEGVVCECGKTRTSKPFPLPLAFASSVCTHMWGCGDIKIPGLHACE